MKANVCEWRVGPEKTPKVAFYCVGNVASGLTKPAAKLCRRPSQLPELPLPKGLVFSPLAPKVSAYGIPWDVFCLQVAGVYC